MSLGEKLRSAREQAGLSVEDVVNATKMTRTQVEGLEANDYRAFSAPVYTKGFIKIFARAVGLEPEPLVKEYLANPNGTEQHDPSREIPVVALQAANPESGAFESVRPKLPHAPPPHEETRAPVKKVAAAPAEPAESGLPEPASEKPAPEKPAEEREKTLLDFMADPEPAETAAAPAVAAAPAAVPAALAEKRIAPVEPGVVPPEPPLKLVRFDDPVRKPAPAPVAKPRPEPDAVGAPSRARSAEPPVVPAPVERAAAPFVFPGPQHVPAAAKPKPAAADAASGADELVAPRPAKPARTAELFPDDALSPAPDAPNPVKLFFSNLGDAFGRFGSRVRAAAATPRARRVCLALSFVVVAAVLVSLFAGLLSGGGEVEPLPGDIVDPPPEAPVVDLPGGPVEIVPVLPAPRSFAK